jgi:hypothetical protein
VGICLTIGSGKDNTSPDGVLPPQIDGTLIWAIDAHQIASRLQNNHQGGATEEKTHSINEGSRFWLSDGHSPKQLRDSCENRYTWPHLEEFTFGAGCKLKQAGANSANFSSPWRHLDSHLQLVTSFHAINKWYLVSMCCLDFCLHQRSAVPNI